MLSIYHSIKREVLLRSYYFLKPLIPRNFQVRLRSAAAVRKKRTSLNTWPIDVTSAKPPKNWPGWPDGKQFALVLTHDVESKLGLRRVQELVALEESLGFKSSFNFVPKKYVVSTNLVNFLFHKGFEVGVHGLYHDGKLFNSYNRFLNRAGEINKILKSWKAVGFRAPSMIRNLDWISNLDIEYDLSTFDTDPFEPQSEGVATIFPYIFKPANLSNNFVELPYTLPQDFTIFVLLQQKNTKIWEDKLGWIAKNKGMALLNVHPDYMCFDNLNTDIQSYPASYYKDFLLHVKLKYGNTFWNPLPKDISAYFRKHYSSRSK